MELQYDEQMKQHLIKLEEAEEQKEAAAEMQKRTYGDFLDKQIEETEKKTREVEYQNFMEEKTLIDQLVRRILEDDEKSVTMKLYRLVDISLFLSCKTLILCIIQAFWIFIYIYIYIHSGLIDWLLFQYI